MTNEVDAATVDAGRKEGHGRAGMVERAETLEGGKAEVGGEVDRDAQYIACDEGRELGPGRCMD